MGLMMRDLVWRYYKALKAFRHSPLEAALTRSAGVLTASLHAHRLSRTGSAADAPAGTQGRIAQGAGAAGIPLYTNASENDLRTFVTKRKVSGDTMSCDGRIARDTMLGLMKTCRKLGVSFYHFLGDRLGLAGKTVPPLATLVLARA